MDSVMGMSIKRSKKSNYEGQDIISNLPDVIIGRILSFLPTKDAVRTCVLSNRWKYLWTFIVELHFNDRDQYRNKTRKTRFSNFLYSVLLHLNTSSIQSFSLSLSEKYDPYHVNQWISAMLNRRVKELCINSNRRLDISSHSLWKSQSLEKLVLIMINGCAIRVSTFVCLSYLTVLKLYGITFVCDPSNDSQNLTLKFPVLKKYKIYNCSWSNVKRVTFEVPLLEVLSIRQTCFPISQDPHIIIKFCAPCLTEFSYVGYLLPGTNLLDLSTACIASAIIDAWDFGPDREKTGFRACELLKQLNNNVECLKFERSKVLALAPNDLPTFGMLSRLELDKVNGEILLMFLRNTPFLKTLILQEIWQFGEELSNPENVPSCFISNLEVVKFERITGVEHELHFAKFVMEYAQVLKQACFSPTWNLHWSIFEKARKKILSFKKSDSFEVIVSPPYQPAIS